MFVVEESDLPQVTTTNAVPVRLGKHYLKYDAITRIDATVVACDPVNNDAASWHLKYSFALISFFGVPYSVGAIVDKGSLNGGSMWDAQIVATFNEVDDTPAKMWFEIRGELGRTILWGGSAKIWTLNLLSP